MKKFFIYYSVLFFFFWASAQSIAQENENRRILFILDASSSMTYDWNNVSRYEEAKVLISRMVDSLYKKDPNIQFSLRLIGSKSPAADKNCYDTRVQVPFNKENQDLILQSLDYVKPIGWSPINLALHQAADNELSQPDNYKYGVVLLTDGKESCGGDICATVEEYLSNKFFFQPYIIGLDPNEDLKSYYSCIGEYLPLRNKADEDKVIQKVTDFKVYTKPVANNGSAGGSFPSVGSIININTDSIARANQKTESDRIAREKAEERARAQAERQAQIAAQQKAKQEADAKAKADAERKAQEKADALAKAEALKKAQEEAKARAQKEADRKAQEEADRIAQEKADAEAKAKEEENARIAAAKAAQDEADRIAREKAEAEAQAAAEEQARKEAELQAQLDAEARAQEEAERKAQEEADRIAQEKADADAKAKAEEDARIAAAKAAQEEADRIAREKAEAQARADAEARAEAERMAKLQAEEDARMKALQDSLLQEQQNAQKLAEAREKAEADKMAKAKAEEEAKLRKLQEDKEKFQPSKLPTSKSGTEELTFETKAEASGQTTLQVFLRGPGGKLYKVAPLMKLYGKDPKNPVLTFNRFVDANGNPKPIEIPDEGNYNLTFGEDNGFLLKNVKIIKNTNTKVYIDVNPGSIVFQYGNNPDKNVQGYTATIRRIFPDKTSATRQKTEDRVVYEPGNYHIVVNTLPELEINVDVYLGKASLVSMIQEPGKVVLPETLPSEVIMFYSYNSSFKPFIRVEPGSKERTFEILPGSYSVEYFINDQPRRQRFLVKSNVEFKLELK